MVEIKKIEKYLLEADGSTRDITFIPTTLGSIENLLAFLLDNKYLLYEAYDNDGCSIKEKIQERDFTSLQLDEGSLFLKFRSGISIINNLIIFIDWPEDDKFAVEISFFPRDINMEIFTIENMMEYIEKLSILLNASDYFVRYENASWDLYDPKGLGVIYTRKELQT